jgi:hypothetical protein
MPETLLSLEVLRILISGVGIILTVHNRTSAHARQAPLRAMPVVESKREEEERRMRLTRAILSERIQTILLLLQIGFMVDAVVNGFSASAGAEQANVLTSNLLQIMTPLALIAISRMLAEQMQATITSERLVPRTGGERGRWSYLRETYVSDDGEPVPHPPDDPAP